MNKTSKATAPGNDPCSAPRDEQIPAKIWELLRRNKPFRQAVGQLHRLDTRAKREQAEHLRLLAKRRAKRKQHLPCPRSWWVAARKFLQSHSEAHPFAASALQWLVPEPLFIIQEVGLPPGDGSDGKPVVFEFRRLGEGTTPDATDSANWRYYKNPRMANLTGRRIVRGPEIRWRTDNFDGPTHLFPEWQDYAKNHGAFTVNDSWVDVPPGFKRDFQSLWKQFDSRTGANPAHETNFFTKFSLLDFARRTSGKLNVEDAARLLDFNRLAHDYRVFAVPRALRTKGAVRAAFKKLAEQVAKDLPDEHALFGTPGQWNDFLAVEALCKRKGTSRESAIHSHLCKRYEGKRSLTELRQASEGDMTGRVTRIETLRDGIYPKFDLPVLLKPVPHRRSSKPRAKK